jgi:prolipoprotein diacylglyceryltransferase
MANGWRMAQVVSGVGIAVGVVGLWWLYQQGKRLPDVVPDKQSPLNR